MKRFFVFFIVLAMFFTTGNCFAKFDKAMNIFGPAMYHRSEVGVVYFISHQYAVNYGFEYIPSWTQDPVDFPCLYVGAELKCYSEAQDLYGTGIDNAGGNVYLSYPVPKAGNYYVTFYVGNYRSDTKVSFNIEAGGEKVATVPILGRFDTRRVSATIYVPDNDLNVTLKPHSSSSMVRVSAIRIQEVD